MSPAKLWDAERVVEGIQEFARLYGRPPTARDWNVAMARSEGRHDLVERFYADLCWPHTGTVLTYFSSWSAALRAAGFEPLTPGYHYEDNGTVAPNGVGKRYAKATHCKHGHSLEDAYVRANGHRICRVCAKRTAAEGYQRRKAQRGATA